jgi:hypothetical protein
MNALGLLGMDVSGDPPRLHWGRVLLLSFLTLGAFGALWLAVQALWVRRVSGRWIGLALATPFAVIASCLAGADLASKGFLLSLQQGSFDSGWYFLLWVAAVYTVRWELSQDPIGFQLGWFMPFFFGPLYFQYRLSDWGMGRESGRPLGLLR